MCVCGRERAEEDERKAVRDIVGMCEHKDEQKYYSYLQKYSVCIHMGPNTWLCVSVGQLGPYVNTTFLQ